MLTFINKHEWIFKLISALTLGLFLLSKLSIIDLNKVDYRLTMIISFSFMLPFLCCIVVYASKTYSVNGITTMFKGIKTWTIFVLFCAILVHQFSDSPIKENIFNETNKSLIRFFINEVGSMTLLTFFFSAFAFGQVFLIKQSFQDNL